MIFYDDNFEQALESLIAREGEPSFGWVLGALLGAYMVSLLLIAGVALAFGHL